MFIPATIFLAFFSSLCCADLTDYLSVGYSRGRSGDRVTELSLVLSHEDMRTGTNTSVESVGVEVRTGEGCWTRVEDNPVRRGRDKVMWRVKIVPCNIYHVRLVVEHDSCVEYHDHPTQVGPADNDAIHRSHYRPVMPHDIMTHRVSHDSVKVTWDQSSCAEYYTVLYESHDNKDSGNTSLSMDQTSVILTDLLNNTVYTVYVTAVMGEEFSDEAEADFATNNLTKYGEVVSKDKDTNCHYVQRECGRKEELAKKDLVIKDHKKEEDNKDLNITIIEQDITTNAKIQKETEIHLKSETQTQSSTAMQNYGQYFWTFLAQFVLLIILL